MNHKSFSTHFFTLGNTATLFPGFEVKNTPRSPGTRADGVVLDATLVPIPGGQPDEWITPNVSTAFLFTGSCEIGFPQWHLQAVDVG